MYQHGGIYVKRSAKFNEKEMRNMLQSYVNAGTPVRVPFSIPQLSLQFKKLKSQSFLKHITTCEISNSEFC